MGQGGGFAAVLNTWIFFFARYYSRNHSVLLYSVHTAAGIVSNLERVCVKGRMCEGTMQIRCHFTERDFSIRPFWHWCGPGIGTPRILRDNCICLSVTHQFNSKRHLQNVSSSLVRNSPNPEITPKSPNRGCLGNCVEASAPGENDGGRSWANSSMGEGS